MIKGVPYDAEIAFLESTGTQYTNTGISVASDDAFQLDMTGAFTGTSSNVQLHGVNGGAYFGMLANGHWTVAGLDTNVASDTATHAFSMSATIGSSKLVSLSIDVNTYTRTRNNDAGIIGLFTLIHSGTQNPLNYYCKFRMCACKIYVNGVLVRDYIPVRVGTVGYLYDRVTRRLFGNAGTGAFTLGPDVATPVMSLHRMAERSVA